MGNTSLLIYAEGLIQEVSKGITFPESFKCNRHALDSKAKHWTLSDSNGNVLISVVGGGYGFYGDGVTTFEMWDRRFDEPEGWLSEQEINIHLLNNPL